LIPFRAAPKEEKIRKGNCRHKLVLEQKKRRIVFPTQHLRQGHCSYCESAIPGSNPERILLGHHARDALLPGVPVDLPEGRQQLPGPHFNTVFGATSSSRRSFACWCLQLFGIVSAFRWHLPQSAGAAAATPASPESALNAATAPRPPSRGVAAHHAMACSPSPSRSGPAHLNCAIFCVIII
jgi:hypothetical protein